MPITTHFSTLAQEIFSGRVSANAFYLVRKVRQHSIFCFVYSYWCLIWTFGSQSGGANLIPLAFALLAGALIVPWTLAVCSWTAVFGSISLWLIVGVSVAVHHAPVLRSGACGRMAGNQCSSRHQY
jgi:hypothetical protein